ncbi:MAG: hypothetical protein WC455_17955 [Dehalococcoidia bacterium]|jgi:hypothetical protein
MADQDKKILKPEAEEQFIDFINKQVKDHPVVKEHHAKWKELVCWSDGGEQFSEWDIGSNKMVAVPLKKRKKRVVINLMKPLVEAIEGKINFISSYAGMPNSSDQNDISAAKTATRVLGHNDYINDTEALNEELKYWMCRTGNACKKWIWDRGAFGWIKGDKGPTKQEGELIGSVPSIFNVRPDPTAKTREEMRWLVELSEVTQDSILENFDIDEAKLKEAVEGSGSDGKYVGMFEKENEKDRDEKTYIVKYYWEKSSNKYENGRHMIVVGNIVLWRGENPALGEIPYFFYGFKRYGNSLWHTGPLHHVQDIQREYNRMASIISEHIEGWKPKMVVPMNSIIKDGGFTSDNYELVEIDSTKGEPRPMAMPELSPQVLANREFLAGALNTVSNVHEVSYSQLPQYSSRAPASLYSMMLEQENLKIDPMIKRINKTLLEEGRFRMRMIEKYYKQERLIKVVGKSNEASVESFKGADLKGNTDVKLNIGVSLHQSKVVQQRLLLELKGQGAPIDWNKIFKLLGEGDLEQELRGDIADETRAQRENQCFINDDYKKKRDEGGVFVFMHDNHELHLDYHTNLAKTEEAQAWDEAKWNALMAHIAEHYGWVIKIKQLMAQVGGANPQSQMNAEASAAAPTTEAGPSGPTGVPGAAQPQGAEQPAMEQGI